MHYFKLYTIFLAKFLIQNSSWTTQILRDDNTLLLETVLIFDYILDLIERISSAKMDGNCGGGHRKGKDIEAVTDHYKKLLGFYESHCLKIDPKSTDILFFTESTLYDLEKHYNLKFVHLEQYLESIDYNYSRLNSIINKLFNAAFHFKFTNKFEHTLYLCQSLVKIMQKHCHDKKEECTKCNKHKRNVFGLKTRVEIEINIPLNKYTLYVRLFGIPKDLNCTFDTVKLNFCEHVLNNKSSYIVSDETLHKRYLHQCREKEREEKGEIVRVTNEMINIKLTTESDEEGYSSDDF